MLFRSLPLIPHFSLLHSSIVYNVCRHKVSRVREVSSPRVGKQAIHDTGPPVLGGQYNSLLQFVVLLGGVASSTHYSGFLEGGP